MKKVIFSVSGLVAGLLLASGVGLFLPTEASATGGSDSPTPYSVTEFGVTLPDGESFEDGGHVNITSSLGSKGIHFEALNNQPSGEWIGQNFLPWSAFGLTCGDTVSWVQVWKYNEHFGEGGQEPVAVHCDTNPPVDPPVEVCWSLPDGGTDLNVTWPQTYVPDCVPACETWLQVDTYPTSAVADLIADGLLEHKEDWDAVISWRFVKGDDCAEVPSAPNPEAGIASSCGVANAWLSNPLGDAETRLTASAVLYVDGVFRQAVVALGGETTQFEEVTFPEDSGIHTVTVRTGPAFGDILLSEKSIESDCLPPEQPENEVTTSEWKVGEFSCGDTTVFEYREVTTVEYFLEEGEWVAGSPVKVQETLERDLTQEEKSSLVCVPTLASAGVSMVPVIGFTAAGIILAGLGLLVVVRWHNKRVG